MAEDDDLLHKADALMRRHRVFVAGAADAEEPATETVQDDVPVLTEVVTPEAVQAPLPPSSSAAQLEGLRKALALELETWLDEELPQHVMRVLDGITDQLIIQLALKARSDLLPRLQGILPVPPEPAKPEPADD